MMLKSVTEGTTPVLLAGALALMAQGAWSDESNDSAEPAVSVTASEAVAAAKQSAEIDLRAAIEAFNKRLSEELTREIEALDAARVELVIAEVPTRG